MQLAMKKSDAKKKKLRETECNCDFNVFFYFPPATLESVNVLTSSRLSLNLKSDGGQAGGFSRGECKETFSALSSLSTENRRDRQRVQVSDTSSCRPFRLDSIQTLPEGLELTVLGLI